MLRLLRFTFLNGPKESGKSTLARLLQLQDPNLAIASFAEPIRMALLATFHSEQLSLGIDLRDSEIKKQNIPGTGVTYRKWMIEYGKWTKTLFGPQIFGDLATRQIETLDRYYDRFVFDDCRFVEEIQPFANAFGAAGLLIIHLERSGSSWADDVGSSLLNALGVQHFILKNDGAPIDMLTRLSTFLETVSSPLVASQEENTL